MQSIVQVISELPSGVFADFFGRKITLFAASFCKVVYITLVFLINGFPIAIVAYVFYGFSLALESGADNAFLYDTLKQQDREDEYKQVEGRAFSYALLGRALGGLFGGLMAGIAFDLPVIFSGVAFAIATLVTLAFTEPTQYTPSGDRKYFHHLKVATIFAWHHQQVRWLLLFSALMTAASLIAFRFFQPYMEAVGIKVEYFGVIYLVWLLTSSVAARYAYVIENRLGELVSLSLIPLLLGIHLLIMGSGIHLVGVIFIILGQFIWGFLRPIVIDYIHRHVASHHRATVLSLNGFGQSIVLGIFSPIFGYIADVLSLPTAVFLEGVLVLVLGGIFVLKITHAAAYIAPSSLDRKDDPVQL